MAAFNSQKLLSALVENWPAKVLSVVLALFLFVFHRLSILENRFFSVPLHVEANPDFVPANTYPHMVRVTLRGEANSIFPIQEEDIVVYLDLKRYSAEGTYRAPVQFRKKGTALGVEPLEISVDPVEITLELDQKVSKYISINPSFNGSLEPGYELVSYTLSPTQVVVDGPEKLMESLQELHTETIDLGGRSEDFFGQFDILLEDPRMVIRGAGTAEFHGIIKRLIIIRSFENLPVTLTGLSDEFTAVTEITSGSIRVQGNQNELEGYSPTGTILSVDCSRITEPGNYILPVHVNIPSQFTFRSDPSAVTVQVYAK
jgi:YbbR domain-containing protein